MRCTSSPKHPPDTLLCHYCIGIRLDGLPVQRAAGCMHRILMLVAKVRNRKWRLISRTCCPPPAAALRATQGACGAL